jgi:hypothetical protein
VRLHYEDYIDITQSCSALSASRLSTCRVAQLSGTGCTTEIRQLDTMAADSVAAIDYGSFFMFFRDTGADCRGPLTAIQAPRSIIFCGQSLIGLH